MCGALLCVLVVRDYYKGTYYGVATISRLHKIIGLFFRILVSFVGLFCKRDLYFKGAYLS